MSPEDPVVVGGGEKLVEAVSYAAHHLLQTKPVFDQQPTSGDSADADAQATICRGLSRIACSLAINHTAILFSPAMNEKRKLLATGAAMSDEPALSSSFSSAFLEYLLGCSAHQDIDVAEPTLEFWFFFLDKSTHSGSLWQLLTTVAEQEHVLSLLGRLVNALIDHCRYPTWFIDSQQITSDDTEIEAVARIRRYVLCPKLSSCGPTISTDSLLSYREIADTLLSLFSKWPGLNGERVGNFHSCVKGMVDLLFSSADIALVDAILFLLEYMIELFDIDSSDSDSDSGSEQDAVSQSSEGIQLLQSVLNNAHRLPTHPLIINGIARYNEKD